MVGIQPHIRPDGTWKYPVLEEMLEKVGIYRVCDYI